MAVTRNWLATLGKRELPGPALIKSRYGEFRADIPTILARLSLEEDEVQFVEYVQMANEWLLGRQEGIR
jgi:hypothetical protein